MCLLYDWGIEMEQILNTLYLGSLLDGYTITKHQAIQHIVNLSQFSYPCESRPVTHAPFPDETYIHPELWQRLVLMLEGLLCTTTVLVHCRLGVSRSPALVAAYLAKIQQTTPWEALKYIRAKRPMVSPHTETWKGVMEWWKVYGIN